VEEGASAPRKIRYKSGGLQPRRSHSTEKPKLSETQTLSDDDLHDTGAGWCRSKAGCDGLVEGEQRALISAKAHAARGSTLQECHHGDGHRGPVLDDGAELYRTDSSVDGGSIDRSPNKEFATARTREA